VADFIPFFVDDPLQFEPSQRWSYSNAGYIVLGAIIEKVPGQDYYDYVREHVFKPAGMTNTDCYELDRDTPNLAIGYTRMSQKQPQPGPRRNNLLLHGLRGGPAGGGYSTVEDLLRFDSALRSHKLLDAKYTDLVLTGKVKTDPDEEDWYAYGFGERRVNGKRIVGHTGGFPGISSALEMHLDTDYTAAVLSNYGGGAQAVTSRLTPMLVREWQPAGLLRPILLQQQLLNSISMEHVVQREMPKHNENGIVTVFRMLGGALPILGRELLDQLDELVAVSGEAIHCLT
jgi:CubicO group peptidase (beta-lactamase class C family)